MDELNSIPTYKSIYLRSHLENWPVKYELVFQELGSPHWFFILSATMARPGSLREKEFLYIHNFIKKHNLVCGYEMATGFGISALAAGLAMKETGGKLITVDAYIEEHCQDLWEYKEPVLYTESLGYTSVNHLMKEYSLQDVIFPKIGWSPRDIPQIVEEHIDVKNGEMIDYVFIDGLHMEKCVIDDLEVVYPYINKNKFAIFLHDVDPNWKNLHNYLKARYGKSFSICHGCEWWNDGFNLSILTPLE